MASKISSDASKTAGYLDKDLDENQQKKSVLITNVPPGTKQEEIVIYFQKPSIGGGEVNTDETKMLEDGKAIVVFDEEEVATCVLKKKHHFKGTLLKMEPYIKSTDDIQVFTLVSAKLDPSCFTIDVKELHNLLVETREKTGVDFLETCEGFMVSGTLEQIDKSCRFLSKYAKPPDPKRKSSNGLESDEGDHPLSDSEVEGKSLEMMILDVEPKLMHLLRKELDVIEKKYKMKIDWKSKTGKAHLSPNGKDASLFDQGKEEFITLYQKEFQDLWERDLSLDAVKNIADLEKTTNELTKNFAVVFEKKDENVLHIFGKEEDVSQVMQTLQAKFGKRRGRKAYKEPGNGELPKPDTYAQAVMQPLRKELDNGVVVSVHQGDITKVQVDVIVNAANERLDHGGGVAGAIVKQGGWQIQQESHALVHRYGCVPVGQVAHTSPGRLPCKRIFHAVGPRWKFHGEERSRQFIFDACMNSFNLATQQRATSIALPGISSGIYGVPKEICAEMMFAAAEMFSADAPSDNLLKDIRFVNIDSPTYEAFGGEFLNRYDMKKSEGVVFERSPDDSASDHSREADTREYQKSENFETTVRAGHIKAHEDPDSKKRADAAVRRITQDSETKSAAGESKPPFMQGFERKEKKSHHEGKVQSHGLERNGKHGPRAGEEKDPKPTAKEEITEKEKVETEKEKKEKEEEKGEREKENKDGNKKESMKEEKERGNEKADKEDHIDLKKMMFEGKDQNDLTGMLSSMRIQDIPQEKDAEVHVEKIETNEHNDPETAVAKKVDCVMTAGTENSDAATSPLHSKPLTMCGRGRGALGHFAPKFPNRPGHAVRDGSTKVVDFSHRDDKDVSECDKEKPPGLSVSPEGLELAKTLTEEPNANARKKQLDSVDSNEGTDGVPSKKVKVDKGEKIGELSKEHEESKAKTDLEEHDNPDIVSRKDARDKKDVEVETRISDMPVSDESEMLKKDENKNVDQHKTVSDERKEGIESEEGDDDGQDSDQNSKDSSTITTLEGTGPEKITDLKDEGVGDGPDAQPAKPNKPLDFKDTQGSDQDTNENESSAISSDKIKPTKAMDVKDERVEDTKDGKTTPHTENKISSVKPDDNHHISDQDFNEKSSGDTPDDESISLSGGPDSMTSFVLVSMPPNNDQDSLARDARRSGSSDESSEGIEVINHTEEEEFFDASSSPVNEQEGDDGHAAGQDVDRPKVGINGEKTEDGGRDAETEEDEKLPVLSKADRDENDKKEEDDATGSGGMGENPDEERTSPSTSVEDTSRADEGVTGSLKKADSGSANSSLPTATEDQECRFCYEKLDLAQAVKICDHLFCQNCVKRWKQKELSNTCKVCHKSAQIALQPLNGQMKSGVTKGSLTGHEGCETLYIDYEFPKGIQGPFHPNPGTPYDELSRRTFLPNNEDGKEVLELLKKAFDAEVLFTVGKSTITGKDNQVVFIADIDHKTNIKGGPAASGYPDPGYLSRVKEQLKAKGIK